MNKEDLKVSAWFMIALVIALLMCFAGLFSSCRTPKTTDSFRLDSIYIEKLIPVATPPDSASIRALFECDENGKVVLRWLDIANSKNVQLKFKLDSLGHMMADMIVPGDTVYLPSKEKKVYREKKVTNIVYVEKKLNLLQKLSQWIAGLGILYFILIIIRWMRKIRK